MLRRIPSMWLACSMITSAAIIAGCSGGSDSIPVAGQSITRSTQQFRARPDAVQTLPPGTLTEYKIPTHHSHPYFITLAGDGNLWFTQAAFDQIGRITPAGVITEFSAGSSMDPNDMRTGPDGHAWFGAVNPSVIGRVAYDGSVKLYAIPTSSAHPEQLVGDKSRNAIWFTEIANQAIGKFSLISHKFTEYPIAPPAGGGPVHPEAIALDRTGTIWFSDNLNSQVDEMTGQGVVLQRLNLPAPNGPGSLTPYRMTLGSDGFLWVNLLSGGPNSHGAIAKVSPATGAVTVYYPPSAEFRNVEPFDVVAVPDSVWITEGGVGIAKVGLYGHFTEYAVRGGGTGITIGSDQNLWFSDYGTNSIAKVTLSLVH